MKEQNFVGFLDQRIKFFTFTLEIEDQPFEKLDEVYNSIEDLVKDFKAHAPASL